MTAALQERLARMSPRQRAALLHGLRSAAPGVPPHPGGRERAPLSSSQRRMLFAQALDPATRALHTISGVAEVPMALDRDRLRRCVAELVRRHEVLRTTFHLSDGDFVGRVHSEMALPVEFAPTEMTDEQAEHVIAGNARCPFDTATGPLAHFWVRARGAAVFTLQVTMSHLVSDGYSDRVLFEELATLYGMTVPRRLEPLSAQFSDYAWHVLSGRDDAARSALGWWRGHLDGAPPATGIPFDRPVRPLPDRGATRIPLEMAPDLYARLQERASSWGTTPFVVMLAALSVVIARWSEQEDLVLGAPMANRDSPGSTALIGPFLNTVALRLRLGTEMTFADVVNAWRTEVLDGMAHQATPFELVVEAVASDRVSGLPPLVQTLLNVQADFTGATGSDGVSMTEVPSGSTEIPWSMTWILGERAVGHVDAWDAVYDGATTGDAIEAFFSVLAAGLDAPASRWTHLPLLRAARLEKILRGESRERPRDEDGRYTTPVDLFLERARRFPDEEKLVDAHHRLDAGTVAALSAGLARRLAEAGVVPGDRVCVVLPRSAAATVTCIAIARLGATFVPIDVRQPKARMAAIIEDAQPCVVVTDADVDALPDPPEQGWKRLEWDVDDLPDADPYEPTVRAEIMYVIYTSGSTGVPKGVLVSSDSCNNLLAVVPPGLELTRGERVLNVVSLAFDMTIFEQWVPLAWGGTAVMADEETAHDPRLLAALLADERVSVMQVPPAFLSGLRTIGWAGAPGMSIVSGGDVLTPPLGLWLAERVGALWNGYGPTENTVFSHMHRVSRTDAGRAIPIGPPIGNNDNLVVDLEGRPVPPGVPGELWLGGDSVAVGYHERPDLTSARFPLLQDAVDRAGRPQRWYRTGDKATWDRSGEIHFLGRLDLQVKIRGFRVELGEIESALIAAPAVRDGVVTTIGEGDDKEILAFVVAEPGFEEATVLDAIAATVPPYMIPSRVVTVAAFPQLTSGKVDRRKLAEQVPPPGSASQPRGASPARPAEESPSAASAATVVAGAAIPADQGASPATEEDRRLLQIWREVLGRPRLGMDDDFFASGGHSLLATQLLFQVSQHFGVDVPLQLLFSRSATAAEMAAFLAGAERNSGDDRGRELDLAGEAGLPPHVVPDCAGGRHTGTHPMNPLVTGVSGFIGSFVAARLLDTGSATVFGLVRAANRDEGMRRIRATMEQYRIWKEEYADLIVPVPGDLSRPRLGLTRPAWDHLAGFADAIYHAGADVNFVRPYAAMKPTNVLGTQYVLELAAAHTLKPLHHISTIYVYDRFSHAPGTYYAEDLPPLHGLTNTFGYSQTKWVAERFVEEAARRGFPVTIHRLGRVTGAVDTAISPSYDLVWRAAKVGIDIGAVPDVPMAIDMTPVDWIAAAIVHISRKPSSYGRAFNLTNPTVLQESDFVRMSREYGYDVTPVTFAEWRDRVLTKASTLRDDTAGALAPFLTGALPLDEWPTGDIGTENVQEALADADFSCRAVDADLVGAYYNNFVASGVLPAPTPAGRAVR